MKRTMIKIFLGLLFLMAAAGVRAGVSARPEGLFIDGRYFFPVGVNYMPRDSAVYLWQEFDPGRIAKEFQLLHSMGLNTIRTFVFWSDLNPAPGKICPENLDRIQTLLDLAGQNQIKVILTLNTGHMSGENWYPKWMRCSAIQKDAVCVKEPYLMSQLHLPHKSRSIYEDKPAQDNAMLQAKALAERFKDHPALLYYDLGNENQYWQRPRTPELGQKYVAAMVAEIKKHDPNHPVAIGMGKFLEQTGFESYGEFGINAVEDLYIVHTYPAGYYPPSAKTVDRFVTYYAGFENNLSGSAGLPVQFQEFGMSAAYLAAMSGEERELRLAGYYRNSLWGALLAGANAGALGWCFADFSPLLASRRPYNTHAYELYFGVVDREYNLKSSGVELKRFAEITREILAQPASPHFDPVAIVLPENYMNFPSGKERKPSGKFADSHANHNRFLFSAFLAMRQLGVNPRFITAEKEFFSYQLLVIPDFAGLSDELKARIRQVEGRGSAVYVSTGEAEVETALRPSDAGLDRMRRSYQARLEKAGVRPLAKSSEPFVETGMINGKYWVAINHLDRPVRAKIEFSSPVVLTNCRYGNTPAPGGSSVEFSLKAFGVEVCEATKQ